MVSTSFMQYARHLFKFSRLQKNLLALQRGDCFQVFTKIFQISKLPAEISLTESDSSVSSSNSATPRRRLKRRTKPSKLRVVVKQGDLLASTCDVVVNPVSFNFALDGKN